MQINKGMGRIVISIGKYAIKFPSFHNGQQLFVMGMIGNLNESERWQNYAHPQLAQVYHCGPLGLWLVMKRYHNIVNRRLSKEERRDLPFIGIDDNGANIATDNGKLVLIDYGNADWYLVKPCAQ